MSLTAKLAGREISCRTFKEDAELNKVPTFTIEVPTRDILGLTLFLQELTIFRDGTQLAGGIIREPKPIPKFNSSSSAPLFSTLKCDGYLGYLQADAPSVKFGHFQNQLASVALALTLGEMTSTIWSLGDTSTLQDIEITLDTREKQSVWSVLTAIADEAGEAMYFRYGGKDASGTHLLDVGAFGLWTDTSAIWGENVLDAPRFKSPTREPVKTMVPIGGAAPDEPISLSLALNIDSTLADATQDYQIVGETIVNNTISNGIKIRQKFSDVKTENDDEPTAAELNECALALYRAAVKEMQASEEYLTVSVKVELDSVPVIGNLCWIDGTVYEQELDMLTGEINTYESFAIRDYLRIMKYSSDYRERLVKHDKLTLEPTLVSVYELDLSSSIKLDTYDAATLAWRKADTARSYDKVSSSSGASGFVSTITVSVTHTTVASDITVGGTDYKIFTFAAPATPVGATSAIASVSFVESGYSFVIFQAGGLATDAILYVNPTGGDWDALDSARFDVTWIFTG